VLDSIEFGEGQAAWHLEKSERVQSYVKNDRLDFEISMSGRAQPTSTSPTSSCA